MSCGGSSWFRRSQKPLGVRRLPCLGALGKPVANTRSPCTNEIVPVDPLDVLRQQVLVQETAAYFQPGRTYKSDRRDLGSGCAGGVSDPDAPPRNLQQSTCLYGGGRTSYVLKGAFQRPLQSPYPPVNCPRKTRRGVKNGWSSEQEGLFSQNTNLPSTYDNVYSSVDVTLGPYLGGVCGGAGNPLVQNPVGGPGYTFM